MTRLRTTRTAVLSVAFLAGANAPVRAQDSTAQRDQWMSALSFGLPVVDGQTSPILFTVGGNFTKIRPGTLSPDFSVGTMPFALAFGVIGWGARTGLALPMQVSSRLYILPSAGLSMIGVTPGQASFAGLNTGIALVMTTGTRLGITWHRLWETEGVILVEFGPAWLSP